MSSNEPVASLSRPNATPGTTERPDEVSSQDNDAESNATDDESDGSMELDDPEQTKKEEEYASLGQLESMYYYAVPNREEGESDKNRETQVNSIIEAKIKEDFAKYKIEQPPADVGALFNGAPVSDPSVSESIRLNWRKDKLHVAKSKFLYGYGLEEGQRNADSSRLAELLNNIQEEENEWGVGHEFQRDLSMSDQEWLKAKSDFLEKAKLDPAKKEKIEQQKAKEADEEATDAIEQESRQQDAARAADPESTWEAIEKEVITIREGSRPKGLPELQKMMASLILHWWENPPNSSDRKNCTAINANINLLPDGKAWMIAPTEIELWQKRLRDSLAICEGVNEDPKLESELEKLARCAITFTNRLRKGGLDWKMVLSRDTHRRIFTCLDRATSTSTQNYTQQLANAYFTARKEQLDVLAAITTILPFMHSNGEIRGEYLTLCMEQFKRINSKLGELNLSLALPRQDHSIPIADLEDVAEHLRFNRPSEAEGALAKLLYKVNLLQIPDFKELSTDARGRIVIDRLQAYKEALDIVQPAKLMRDYDDVPLLNTSGFTYAYDGTPMKSVGWGIVKGRKFYINQYGLSTAPVWRLEQHMSQEWQTAYGGSDPPFHLNVTVPVNRYGDVSILETNTKRWGPQHIVGIYGVAFKKDDSRDPLCRLHPDTYESDGSRWDSHYVLVGWDLDGDGIDVQRRWETRTCLRERFGKAEADAAIYKAAMKSQENFELARGNPTEFKSVTLRPKKENMKGPRYSSRKTSYRRDKRETYRDMDRSDGTKASQSHEVGNKRNAVKDGPVTRSSTEAARTEDVKRDLNKMSENNALNEKAVAAIMTSKYGEDWTNCFL
jgi:hypothetical protein